MTSVIDKGVLVETNAHVAGPRLLLHVTAVVSVVAIASVSACSPSERAGERRTQQVSEGGKEALVDEAQADAALDQEVEDVLALLPEAEGTPLVVRSWGPATSPCSPTSIQKSRFVEAQPRIDTTPDDLVRQVAATWRATTTRSVRESSTIRGTARSVLDDPEDGTGVVVSQWDPPLIQITAYSPCYPG